MMFLLHVLLFVYGLVAFLVGKLRTSGEMWDAGNSKLYATVEQFFPESVFKPWAGSTDELRPDLTRTYLVSGGLCLYALRYLFSRHRG
jgi:hypothetical protein